VDAGLFYAEKRNFFQFSFHYSGLNNVLIYKEEMIK